MRRGRGSSPDKALRDERRKDPSTILWGPSQNEYHGHRLCQERVNSMHWNFTIPTRRSFRSSWTTPIKTSRSNDPATCSYWTMPLGTRANLWNGDDLSLSLYLPVLTESQPHRTPLAHHERRMVFRILRQNQRSTHRQTHRSPQMAHQQAR